MKISFYTVPENFVRGKGYSEVCWGMVTSLKKLGYEVPYNNSECKVQINVCQPDYFNDFLYDHQYNIAYVPWESTEIPDHWYEIIDDVDELWTPSTWMANNYKNLNINKQIKVYPHGIFPIWEPLKRIPGSKLRFLHQAEPRVRGGGQQAYDAFKAAFGDNNDVELIIKAGRHSSIRDNSAGFIQIPSGNTKIITGNLKESELVGLYHRCHVMIGNSYGEGFGLTPFQALATGMPSIVTKEWCEYSDYLHELGLESHYIDSPWPVLHPGKMTEPIFDDLVDKLRYTYNNYEELSKKFYMNSFKLHKEYDWETVTDQAFSDIKEKFEF